MEIVLPGDMTVAESHDIALALQHKVRACACCSKRLPAPAGLHAEISLASAHCCAHACILFCRSRSWTMSSALSCTWITSSEMPRSTRRVPAARTHAAWHLRADVAYVTRAFYLLPAVQVERELLLADTASTATPSLQQRARGRASSVENLEEGVATNPVERHL
jgi:hypothetical protein